MFTIPVLDVKTDPLDALLYGLGLRLSSLAGSDNAEFNKLIADKEIAMQFVAGDVARYYRFVDGHFGQAGGTAKHADLTIEFKDSLTGVKLISKGDISALMSAIQDGEVKITGDYKLVLWFAGVVKHATTVPEAYKGYVEQAKPYINKAKPYINQAKPYAEQAFSLIKGKLGK
ncbi:MAG: hypothetical protein Q3971_05515 [Moraxella sp.]|nr:hypothetical protein [Moraxella sp.]